MTILASQDHLCPPSNENILVAPVELCRKVGHTAAVILNQMHYWTRKCGKDFLTIEEYYPDCQKHRTEEVDDHFGESPSFYNLRWVYNSIKDWVQQFPGFSYWQVRSALDKLRKLGLVFFVQFAKSKFKRYGFYAINYERLEEFLKIPETLTQLDVRDTSSRCEDGITSSYITENTNQEITEHEYNNSDDVLTHTSEIDIDLNTQDQEQPINSRVVEKPKLKSQVKPTIPYEDQSCGAARHDTTSPDAEVNNKLVEGLGVILNPKLKRFLAAHTAEEILKAIAAYYYTLEVKQTNVENTPGFVIDAVQNFYLENTSTWTQSSEQNQNLMLLAAGLMALGAKLENGFYGVAVTGEIVFVDKTGERQAFDGVRINQIVQATGIVEALKVAWKTYLDVAV